MISICISMSISSSSSNSSSSSVVWVLRLAQLRPQWRCDASPVAGEGSEILPVLTIATPETRSIEETPDSLKRTSCRAVS